MQAVAQVTDFREEIQNFRYRLWSLFMHRGNLFAASSKGCAGVRLGHSRGNARKGSMRILTLIIALAAVSPTMAQTEPIPAPPPSQTPEQAAAPPKTQDQMPGVNREDFTLPQQPRGRYSFAPVDEGFLRFDHKSGDVTLCRPQATGALT